MLTEYEFKAMEYIERGGPSQVGANKNCFGAEVQRLRVRGLVTVKALPNRAIMVLTMKGRRYMLAHDQGEIE